MLYDLCILSAFKRYASVSDSTGTKIKPFHFLLEIKRQIWSTCRFFKHEHWFGSKDVIFFCLSSWDILVRYQDSIKCYRISICQKDFAEYFLHSTTLVTFKNYTFWRVFIYLWIYHFLLIVETHQLLCCSLCKATLNPNIESGSPSCLI